MRQASKVVAIFMFFAILSACSASIAEEQVVATEAASTVFSEEQTVEVNQESEGIEFYLPSDAAVKKTTENNIVFEKKGKVFILFINSHEGPNSQVVYQSTRSQGADYFVDETFQKDGKFGFILLQENEEESYEVTIGVGGVKATTITSVKELTEDVELMMEIVKSVK